MEEVIFLNCEISYISVYILYIGIKIKFNFKCILMKDFKYFIYCRKLLFLNYCKWFVLVDYLF